MDESQEKKLISLNFPITLADKCEKILKYVKEISNRSSFIIESVKNFIENILLVKRLKKLTQGNKENSFIISSKEVKDINLKAIELLINPFRYTNQEIKNKIDGYVKPLISTFTTLKEESSDWTRDDFFKVLNHTENTLNKLLKFSNTVLGSYSIETYDILLIEDDIDVANTYKKELEDSGCTLKHVSNVKDAFHSLEKHIPKVILVDILLESSSVNGLTFSNYLKTSEKFREKLEQKDTKIFIITATEIPDLVIKEKSLCDYIFRKNSLSRKKYRLIKDLIMGPKKKLNLL